MRLDRLLRPLDRRFELMREEVRTAQRMAARAYEAVHDWPTDVGGRGPFPVPRSAGRDVLLQSPCLALSSAPGWGVVRNVEAGMAI